MKFESKHFPIQKPHLTHFVNLTRTLQSLDNSQCLWSPKVQINNDNISQQQQQQFTWFHEIHQPQQQQQPFLMKNVKYKHKHVLGM